MNARSLSIARSVAVIGGTGALIAGVTFATAFNTNTVTLADNQFDVTNDVLRISNGGAYGTSVTGFNLTGLQLGTESAKQPLYFKNLSNADLTLSVKQGTAPTPNNIDTTKVHIKIYDKDGVSVVLDTTLASLGFDQVITGQLDKLAEGNGAVAGTEGNYSYSVTVDPAAPTGSAPSVSNIDLDFTGTPVTL